MKAKELINAVRKLKIKTKFKTGTQFWSCHQSKGIFFNKLCVSRIRNKQPIELKNVPISSGIFASTCHAGKVHLWDLLGAFYPGKVTVEIGA